MSSHPRSFALNIHAYRCCIITWTAVAMALQFPAALQCQSVDPATKNPLRPKPNLAAVSLDSYLERVRAANSSAPTLPAAPLSLCAASCAAFQS